ncbi:MAG: NUDIX domain-containing protein [Candidatus Accumulibacter sp.]|jgi:ADP-ribose pyrophosphatase YjhB (NUDIX family)|nr:NUDIX domain-containing protein [Accumulibacter sp.]
MAARAGIPTGAHILCERGGRVLLLRRANTGFFDGLYSLPGGHVEEGESIVQAAARELEEETGLRAAPGDLEWLGVIHRRSDTNRIDFFLRARRWSGEPEVREPDKCAALDWFARDALPENLAPYVRVALEAGEGGWMRELGW